MGRLKLLKKCLIYKPNFIFICRFIVLELAIGTMADLFRVDDTKSIECRRALTALSDLTVLSQMVRGLDYLHSKRVVHGDIKPENVLICTQNDKTLVKLSDFGLCKEFSFRGHIRALSQDNSLASSRADGDFTVTTFRGSPAWLSPELIEISSTNSSVLKEKRELNEPVQASTASDVFAYGLVSFYYVTRGIHPFGDYPASRLKIEATIVPNIYHCNDIKRIVNLDKLGIILKEYLLYYSFVLNRF